MFKHVECGWQTTVIMTLKCVQFYKWTYTTRFTYRADTSVSGLKRMHHDLAWQNDTIISRHCAEFKENVRKHKAIDLHETKIANEVKKSW